MTDPYDDTGENGSARPPSGESSIPLESGHSDAAPSSSPPIALPPAQPSVPSAPPMQPTDVVAESVPTSWPTVLGILAIVFGGFGVLGGAWGVVAPFVAGRITEMSPSMPAQLTQQLDAWSGWTTAFSIMSLMAGGLLLFGGISLVRRRHRAAPALFVWSIIKIVLILANVGLQLAVQSQVMGQALSQLPTLPGGGTIMMTSVIIGVGCGLIFQLAWPVFLLIWFRRRVIKEEVAIWK